MNLPYNNIKLLVVVGIAAMLLMFVSFLLIFIFTQRRKYQYQKNIQEIRQLQQNLLIEAAVRSEESERHRIAEELHDEVGALLSSSKLHFQNIRLNQNDPHNESLYGKGNELLDDAINKVRGISHNLHSSILQEFGLLEAIGHFIRKITHEHLVEATISLDCLYTAVVKENDISIYRMVQELVNNILKHAHPQKIHIGCSIRDNRLRLTIFHNGQGLTQDQFEELKFRPDSIGLKIIQNRLILLKGNVLFLSGPDGYTIGLELPIA
jgi:two-component system NarL family sensor kinase